MKSPSCFLVTVAATWIGLVAPGAGQKPCPSPCQCRHDSKNRPVVVDCRNKDLQNVMYDIPSEVIELDFSGNPIKSISRETFPSLNNLKRLSMDNCLLETIEKNTFRNLDSLEILELSNNRIETVDESAFYGMLEIKDINLSNNLISSLPKYLFRSLSLRSLDLTNNKLKSISDSLFVASSVESLYLNKNQLDGFTRNTLKPLENLLKNLEVNENKIPLYCDAQAFFSLSLNSLSLKSSGVNDLSFLSTTSAREINLSGNKLDGVRFPFSPRLQDTCTKLVIRHSQFNSFDENFVKSLKILKHLDLHNNSLSILAENLILPHLLTMDLSYNRLYQIPDNFSLHLLSLKNLNMSQSGIKSVGPHSFSKLTKLNSLDLSFNSIQILSDAVEQLLDSTLSFNISGNPLYCNCEMKWLRDWLLKSSRHIGFVRCVDSKKRTNEDILARDVSKFVCIDPEVIHITKSFNIGEGMEALLRCKAEADPAPDTVWKSPLGDVYSITPSSERAVQETTAVWHLSKLKPDQTGWYSCTASNVKSSVTKYTYVHVVTPSQPPVDLEGLEYPYIPPGIRPLSTEDLYTQLEATTAAANTFITTQTAKFAPKSDSGFSPSDRLPPHPSSDVQISSATVTPNDIEKRKNIGKIVIIVAVVIFVSVLVSFFVILIVILRRKKSKKYNDDYQVAEVQNASLNGDIKYECPYVTTSRKFNAEELPLKSNLHHLPT